MITDVSKLKLPIPLPAGIVLKDLVYPSYKDKDKRVSDYRRSDFGLWCVATREGKTEWFIPTLHISSRRRPGTPERTYAVRVRDGAGGFRIGAGPHVKLVLTVYVRESRVKVLEQYLVLREKGQEVAGQIRDRISSRRAQGQLMRAEGRRSWTWNK